MLGAINICMRKLLYISIIILLSSAAFAEERGDTSETSFDAFLKKLYEKPNFVKNRTTLDVHYGASAVSYPAGVLRNDFASAYPAGLGYGFTRFDDKQPIDDIFYYASEFVFIRNNSSHFKPATFEKDGITTDSWHFGGGISNGYGYGSEEHEFFFFHTGRFIWSRIDIELYPLNPFDSSALKQVDENYKFGSSWSGGIKYHLTGPVFLSAEYEHVLVNTDFHFGKWFGSWAIENLSQRWIDFFEEGMMKSYGKNWPWVNWVIKNSLSLALYELRRNNVNWPFDSREALSFNTFRAGITFVF